MNSRIQVALLVATLAMMFDSDHGCGEGDHNACHNGDPSVGTIVGVIVGIIAIILCTPPPRPLTLPLAFVLCTPPSSYTVVKYLNIVQ